MSDYSKEEREAMHDVCINKWSDSLYDRLKNNMKIYFNKGDAWEGTVWSPCGYCKLSLEKTSDGSLPTCNVCPLFKKNICHSSITNAPINTVTMSMYKAWNRSDRKRFEELRKRMVRAIIDTREEFMNM